MTLAALGIFGAALFFGDSMITPAISVLSAVEGLKIVDPGLEELVVPITAVIIVALFAVQRRGTATVGRLFGPVMIVWFLVDRRVRRERHRRRSRRSCGRCPRPTRWISSSATSTSRSSPSPRSCSPSPAPRRSTPTWGISGARRSPWAGWGWCCRPARSTTSARARWCSATRPRCSAPFFLLSPGVGPHPDGAAGDRGDGDRLPGGDHRRVLGRVAGRAARLPAAAAHRAHVGVGDRPDLRAVDQRDADGGAC